LISDADDAGDDGEDHESQHVIDHGRTKNHARLRGLRSTKVLQHPGGDANTGRRQGRAEECVDVRRLVRKHPRAHAPTERERRYDAKSGHENRGETDLQHVRHGRLETDFEEEDDHSQARENFDRGIGLDAVKPTDSSKVQAPERDPSDEFPQHGRLSESNR
jgi:hypothetical protein